MPNGRKPTCFVIAPIGVPASDTRKRSDQVLKYVFEEALGEQYDVTRADKISEPGIITSQIIRALQDSELVIADLTEHNPNVFYELAVRHAIKKPVIHVIDSHWKIPFDVAPLRTIVFDYTDLASVADAKKQLKNQATEIQAGKSGETPIEIANITRPSERDPENLVLLKEAVQGIVGIRAHLVQIGDAIADLASPRSPGWAGWALTPASMLSAPDGSGSIPDSSIAKASNVVSAVYGKSGPIIASFQPLATNWSETRRKASEGTKVFAQEEPPEKK